MYRKQPMKSSKLYVSESYEAESIEVKIQRLMNNKEAPDQMSPLIYTERAEGVRASTNIRTDKWEIAIDAMNKVQETHAAKREQRQGEKTFDTMTDEQQKAFIQKFPKSKAAIAAMAAKTSE